MDETTDRFFGVIKFYSTLKGYGFIRRNKGKDVFFWGEDSENFGNLYEGVTRSFEIFESDRGPRARKIKAES